MSLKTSDVLAIRDGEIVPANSVKELFAPTNERLMRVYEEYCRWCAEVEFVPVSFEAFASMSEEADGLF